MGDRKGGADEGDEQTQRFLNALRHPLRRRILRHVVKHHDGEELGVSPVKTNELFDIGLSTVSYHFRMLGKSGVLHVANTRPRRGATEHFYRPIDAALEHPMVQVALGEKEAER